MYNDVHEQNCLDVPRQECVAVPDQICTNQPLQKCQDVPRQNCQAGSAGRSLRRFANMDTQGLLLDVQEVDDFL